MGLPLRKEEQRFTYGDYLEWPDNERRELIHGVPYDMSPAPSRTHQRILGALHLQLGDYFRGRECEVYLAPFDVRLPQGNEEEAQISTVVQPDMVIVCDSSKLDERGCKGAPDLAIEIMSPHTARKDMREKLSLYEEVGVKEYWVVDPSEEIFMVFTLSSSGQYGKPNVYAAEDAIKTEIFPDLSVNLKEVFEG
jgi:Uma2 family endonuclease